MIKFSIIIPIYNAELYLDRCLQSIIAQTYNDFEVVLIDDGSVDTSLEKCNQWAKADPRVKVFHKENGGVSSARNFGLKLISNEWVCFVDADDELEYDYFGPKDKKYDKQYDNQLQKAVEVLEKEVK